MRIIDRTNDTVAEITGSWHAVIGEKEICIFPNFNPTGNERSNYYKFPYDLMTKDEFINAFAKDVYNIKLTKDIEIIF